MQINLNRPQKLFPCIMNDSDCEPCLRAASDGAVQWVEAGLWNQTWPGDSLPAPHFTHLLTGNKIAY